MQTKIFLPSKDVLRLKIFPILRFVLTHCIGKPGERLPVIKARIWGWVCPSIDSRFRATLIHIVLVTWKVASLVFEVNIWREGEVIVGNIWFHLARILGSAGL